MEGIQNFVSSLNVNDMMMIAGMGMSGYDWQKVDGWESAFTDAPIAVGGLALAGFGGYLAIKNGELNAIAMGVAVGAFFVGKMVSKV